MPATGGAVPSRQRRAARRPDPPLLFTSFCVPPGSCSCPPCVAISSCISKAHSSQRFPSSTVCGIGWHDAGGLLTKLLQLIPSNTWLLHFSSVTAQRQGRAEHCAHTRSWLSLSTSKPCYGESHVPNSITKLQLLHNGPIFPHKPSPSKTSLISTSCILLSIT